MSKLARVGLSRSFVAFATLALSAVPCAADELRAANYRAEPPRPPAVGKHPLAAVLDYARREKAYLQQSVRDFTCRLVKRERIEGFLSDYVHIDMQVREERRQGDKIVQPMCIRLDFVGPAKVAGRRVLYIDGQNDGKMLVRNGGKHFDYVIVNIDPDGDSAHDESLVPITQSGINQVLAQMILVLERHERADPSGKNTEVERIAGAKLNKRPCTVIRVLHPQKQAGLEFHVANVFVDDELRVPVRVDFSDWPKRPGQPPQLIAEYTYTNLKLNVDLPDQTFSRAQLKAR